jgi:HEPN domain-containing protein
LKEGTPFPEKNPAGFSLPRDFYCFHAEKLRDTLSLLMPYAVEIRYPDDEFTPTAKDAQEVREAAEEVMSWLREVFSEIFS